MTRTNRTRVIATRILAILTICTSSGRAYAGPPDPCTVPPGADCNQNGLADECDVDDGLSVDCNENLIPDECEIKRDCPPLGDHFTPGHIFAVHPYFGHCQPGTSHYGIDSIGEINPDTGRSHLFINMPYEWCNVLRGAAVSPDGKRLRIGGHWGVLEFDPRGQWSILSGVYSGSGYEPIAYDREGNFYVTREYGNEKVFRYPADGGPPTVLAYADNNGIPLADAGPTGIAPNGDVYVADYQHLIRITPDGTVSIFDTYTSPYGNTVISYSVVVDDSGFVFVSTEAGGLLRYAAGVPFSRELFIPCTQPFCPMYASDLSPDRSRLWIPWYDSSTTPYGTCKIDAIDPADGSRTFITAGCAGSGGMAVVPLRYDVNDDGESNSADLSIMVSCLDGVNVGPPTPECYAADMDSDWDIDLYDLQSFLRAHTVQNR